MFGGKASFRISERELNFASAKSLYEDKGLWHRNYIGANISDSPPGRSHYWIEQGEQRHPISNEIEECYRLLMYSTYIHTWWEDGTYKSQYYDSAITRTVLTAFGPVRVWSDSRIPFYCKARWGNRANDFPYGNGIVVDPDGWVRNVHDFKDVLKPNAKAERTVIRKRLRNNATHRILLGEFGDAFAAYRKDVKKGFGRWDTGWMAQVPDTYSQISALFYQDADHTELQEAIDKARWSDGPMRPTKDLAMLAAVERMGDQLLERPEFRWYEKQAVEYGDVNVRT